MGKENKYKKQNKVITTESMTFTFNYRDCHEFVSSCFVALFDIVLVAIILSTDLKCRIDFVTFVYILNK